MIAEATGFAETDNEEILSARQRYRELYDKHKEAVSEEHNEVTKLGGLCIIGTERHESRRIDNQLRGRAGRQGDPGVSRFYISLEDDLMRLFGSERLESIVNALGLQDDDVIEHKMLTKAIENAQKRVEGNNFEARKYVLQYDDVMNKQREIIYGQRGKVLNGEDIKDVIIKMLESVVEDAVKRFTGFSEMSDEWDRTGLLTYYNDEFAMVPPRKADGETHGSRKSKI